MNTKLHTITNEFHTQNIAEMICQLKDLSAIKTAYNVYSNGDVEYATQLINSAIKILQHGLYADNPGAVLQVVNDAVSVLGYPLPKFI
jgi:hypothetical protein